MHPNTIIGDDTLKRSYHWIGWVFLGLSFFAGLAVIYWGSLTDEADTLVTGSLITQGYVLYRDVFSHHFPFPYYWVALVVSLLGKSILAVRLSLLVFQVTSFAIAMKFSQYHLVLGLASLLWNLIGYMYLGNLVLYSMFCSAALVVVFSVTLAIVSDNVCVNWKHIVVIGVYATIAMLSDPLSIYAIGIALFFLAVSSGGVKHALCASLVIALALAAYGGYLLLSRTFMDFVDSAILFNAQVYGKYLNTNPIRLRAFLYFTLRGLDITNPAWWIFDPMRSISRYHNYTEFDQWMFTGLLFRLSIIFTSLIFLVRRKFKPAGFVYFFAVALLLINIWGFRGASFVMVALIATSGIVVNQWRAQQPREAYIKIPLVVLRILVCCLLAWQVFRITTYTIRSRHELSYTANFGFYHTYAQEILGILGTCSPSDILLAPYPGDTYAFWFTDMKPVSRYLFMWPWVAEIGQVDVINILDEAPSIVIIEKMKVWNKYNTNVYLHRLHNYLDENYLNIKEGWYISPSLMQQCR